MKVLVTGINGQLGYDVVKELERRNIEYIAAGRNEFDITDSASTEKFIEKSTPDAVIHCAAYTTVDLAEEEKEKAFEVNAEGTKNIALACKKIDAKMIYISTDYVFNGQGQQPYEVDDEKGPLGVYGKSKLKGEEYVREILEKYFIVRISWVFGINGKNFVKTMLNIGKSRSMLTVVNDQIGSPTYTPDLAVLLCDMVQTEKYGVYHATNEGEFISWYDFACEIFKQAGYSTEVKPVTTEEYGISKAERPKNSRLSKKNLDENGFSRLPNWKDALKRYIKELNIER